MKNAKLVLNQEMKQLIIVINVLTIIYFLMNLLYFHKIVFKNAIIIIILMREYNIIVLNLILAQYNIII